MKEKNKHGIVLLYVLAFSLALTTLILTVHSKISIFFNNYIFKHELLSMENYAEAGFAIGKKLIEIDNNPYDWFGESWVKPIEINHDKYSLKILISDEDGKINPNKIIGENGKVNTLLLNVLKNLFTVLGLPDSLLDCLLDWIDEDEIPRNSGAESTYYSMNGYPYIPPNRPLYSIEEILFIKGFNKDILYGKKENIGKQNEEENEENRVEIVKKGLIDFLSIESDDKINVNTCEGEILKAMGYTGENVDLLLAERERRPLNEGLLINVNREVTLNNRRIIKYKSSHFGIEVLVKNNENGKELKFKFSVLKNKKNKVLLLRKEKIWEN